MISIIPDKMPHIELFTNGEITKANIEKAYRDIANAYNGVRDYVSILDSIFEGFYSLSEATIAGVLITDAADGYFIKNNIWEPARYIRINDCEIIFLKATNEVLSDRDVFHCDFESNSGIRYKLKTGKEILSKKKRRSAWQSRPSETAYK